MNMVKYIMSSEQLEQVHYYHPIGQWKSISAASVHQLIHRSIIGQSSYIIVYLGHAPLAPHQEEKTIQDSPFGMRLIGWHHITKYEGALCSRLGLTESAVVMLCCSQTYDKVSSCVLDLELGQVFHFTCMPLHLPLFSKHSQQS